MTLGLVRGPSGLSGLDRRVPTRESPPMPIYTYRCNACRTEFDQLVRSETKVACPECQGRKLERLMSLTARPVVGRQTGRPEPAGAAAGRRMLRRRMPHPQPLTTRLSRLRDRLAVHRPRLDERGDPLIWAAVAVVLAPIPTRCC